MGIKVISSEENPVIKRIKELEIKKYRGKYRQFVVEGIRIVEECLKHNGPLAYAVYCENLYNVQGGKDLLNRLKEKVPVYEIPNQLFDKLSDTDSPQGILAVVNMRENSLEKLFFQNDGNLFFLILDRIQDPGNMGTIIRTAESGKVDGIILTKGCVDPYNSKTIRATMGGIFHLPIIQCNTNEEWMGYLKDKNVRLIGTDLNADDMYIDIDYRGNIGIVIGNEANGISAEILGQVDERVIIPILGKMESLNASIAASILIYKAVEKKYLNK